MLRFSPLINPARVLQCEPRLPSPLACAQANDMQKAVMTPGLQGDRVRKIYICTAQGGKKNIPHHHDLLCTSPNYLNPLRVGICLCHVSRLHRYKRLWRKVGIIHTLILHSTHVPNGALTERKVELFCAGRSQPAERR